MLFLLRSLVLLLLVPVALSVSCNQVVVEHDRNDIFSLLELCPPTASVGYSPSIPQHRINPATFTIGGASFYLVAFNLSSVPVSKVDGLYLTFKLGSRTPTEGAQLHVRGVESWTANTGYDQYIHTVEESAILIRHTVTPQMRWLTLGSTALTTYVSSRIASAREVVFKIDCTAATDLDLTVAENGRLGLYW